jgi:transposase-like protein
MAIVASDLDPADLPDELIDELLAGARTPEEIVGPDGLLQRLTKRLVERAMAAELSEHLGYEHGQAPPGGVGNARNGMTAKTIHTGHGSVRIEQHATAKARSSRRSSRNTSDGSRASTTRSSRCTRAGCRCGTSKRTWPSCTALRSATT